MSQTAQDTRTLQQIAAEWATWIWTKPTKTAAQQEMHKLMSAMIEHMTGSLHGKMQEQKAQSDTLLQAFIAHEQAYFSFLHASTPPPDDKKYAEWVSEGYALSQKAKELLGEVKV